MLNGKNVKALRSAGTRRLTRSSDATSRHERATPSTQMTRQGATRRTAHSEALGLGARWPGGHGSTSGASPANGVGAPRRCRRDSRRCAGTRHGEALGARCASRASTTRQRRGLCSVTRTQREGRSSARHGAGSSMGATIPR